jgi:hypothetical protein
MTTREVYNKLYATCELPVAIAWYATRDKNDVIQLGKAVWINFHDGHEVNIKKMEKVSKPKDFMFWMTSDEGRKFIEDNRKPLANLLAHTILGTRPENEETKI